MDISIHTLREEGDQRQLPPQIPLKKFQSTPSARRATLHNERVAQAQEISIHALREEGDLVRQCPVLQK